MILTAIVHSGESLLQPVRPRRRGRHADGPADQAPPRLRLRHLRDGRAGGSGVRDPLPHHQEQKVRVQTSPAQGGHHRLHGHGSTRRQAQRPARRSGRSGRSGWTRRTRCRRRRFTSQPPQPPSPGRNLFLLSPSYHLV